MYPKKDYQAFPGIILLIFPTPILPKALPNFKLFAPVALAAPAEIEFIALDKAKAVP